MRTDGILALIRTGMDWNGLGTIRPHLKKMEWNGLERSDGLRYKVRTELNWAGLEWMQEKDLQCASCYIK